MRERERRGQNRERERRGQNRERGEKRTEERGHR